MSGPAWQPVPWQGGGPGQPVPSPMLAAHADRERAVDVLRAGFAEGRLQQDEYEKRVEQAYGSRTLGELARLVADLPQGPQPFGTPFAQQPYPGRAAGVPATFLPAPAATNSKATGALVCGVLCVFTGGITGVPAVVLGHMARGEIRRTGEQGDGFALAGLIMGWLSVAGWALFVLLMVAAFSGGQ
ncbi:DUF4190 domain-containing protein [Streptomyces sp. NPDC008150]|uniref:DUF1707 and DUF4190 domain-containing protein n=1 Tax=Streptomyces sp. NPDC008150 TaxID=3364816 RepID=UPI0036F0169D